MIIGMNKFIIKWKMKEERKDRRSILQVILLMLNTYIHH